MSILTVTSKGQVTLRRELLNHLGVAPGEKIAVEKLPGGRIEVTRAKRSRQISDVFGYFPPRDGVRATDEDIEKAIQNGWAGRG